MAICASVEKLL